MDGRIDDENAVLAALLLAQAGTLPSLRHMPRDRRALRAAVARRKFGSTLSLPESGTGASGRTPQRLFLSQPACG